MAEVYLARRRAAGVEKWLVVKRIRPERSNDVRFLDMFMREARLSMSLAHQNIVPVFDFGRIDDQVFLAMERVEGKDLGSSLARAGERRMSCILAAFIAAECCQALDYAHHRKSPEGTPLGIVHRDVTPRNVLLSWSGEVKLTDFGIAALAGDATSNLLGTPQYMAPEQARGEPLDARADVYAVGLLLRETVTGQRARPGGEREATLEAAKAGTLVPWPGELGPEVAPLVAIIDRATAPRPDDRYPDARSMLAELDAYIVGQRAAHKGESPARQLAAWLEEVWVGDHEDRAGTSGELEGNHLVSYLDDGSLDVMGTGTAHSMLATAAEDEAAASPPVAATPAGVAADAGQSMGEPSVVIRPATAPHVAVRPPTATDPGAEAAPPAAQVLGERGGTEAGATRRTSIWMPVALVAITVASLLIVVAIRREDPAERPAPDTRVGLTAGGGQDAEIGAGSGSGSASGSASESGSESGSGSASESEFGSASGSGSGSGSASGSASGSGSGSSVAAAGSGATAGSGGARSGSASTSVSRPDTGRTTPRPGTGSGSGAGAGSSAVAEGTTDEPIRQRKVTINATPWAYFTVGDDPTQHETVKTLQLAPGKHRIRFSNPVLKVERVVTIEVPADRDLSYVERLQN